MKFGSNGKGGPQASNLGQIVRGTTGIKFGSNSKRWSTILPFDPNLMPVVPPYHLNNI